MIISTDYPGPRDTGEAHISMPHTKWGHTYAGWLDSYAGVRFTVGETGGTMSDEYGLDDPNTSLAVGRAYVRFSRDWNPDRSGLQHGKRYSKIARVRFKSGKTIGALRFKVVRTGGGQPDDPTWYHDEVIAADALDESGETVRSFASFESGEADRNLHWEVKCIGGIDSLTIADTRYAGWAVQD
jgi:hypothetical protein